MAEYLPTTWSGRDPREVLRERGEERRAIIITNGIIARSAGVDVGLESTVTLFDRLNSITVLKAEDVWPKDWIWTYWPKEGRTLEHWDAQAITGADTEEFLPWPWGEEKDLNLVVVKARKRSPNELDLRLRLSWGDGSPEQALIIPYDLASLKQAIQEKIDNNPARLFDSFENGYNEGLRGALNMIKALEEEA